MAWERYEAALAREFPQGSGFEARPQGHVLIRVPCSAGHVGEFEFNKHMPPDKARKLMSNNGWRFWGRKTTCPEHSSKEKPVESKPALRAVASGAAMVVSEASDAARTAKRLAMMLLDEQFDVAKGAYKNGYSDAKIAGECEVAEAVVVKLREEFYGAIKEPEVFAEFRAKLDEFEKSVSTYEKAVAGRFSDLRGEVSKLRSEIAAVVRRNGW